MAQTTTDCTLCRRIARWRASIAVGWQAWRNRHRNDAANGHGPASGGLASPDTAALRQQIAYWRGLVAHIIGVPMAQDDFTPRLNEYLVAHGRPLYQDRYVIREVSDQ